MIAFISEWAPFVLLVVLGWLLRTFVQGFYVRLKKRIDDKVPDDLPQGGGPWLESLLRARGLEGEIRVFHGAPSATGIDAYYPSASTIVLSREVFDKRDASFWAVAGHELGHALVHRSSRVVGFVLNLARFLVSTCTRVATFLIFANVLYARTDIDHIAFTLLHVSLVAWAFVLVDELLASTLSLRMLAKDEHVGGRGLVAAAASLGAAFATYLGAFVGQVLLLLNRAFIVERIHRYGGFPPGAPMGGARLTFVTLLGALLLALSIHSIVREVRRPKVDDALGVGKETLKLAGRELARGIVGTALVALVWNQPLTDWFPLLCVGGLLASTGFIRLVTLIATFFVRLVAVIVLFPLFFVVGLFTKDRTPEPEPPPASKRTGANYDRLTVDLHERRTLLALGNALAYPALHVVFVVGLCVALAMS